MNSTKGKPTPANEPGSELTENTGGYSGLAEFRKALGANLRSGLDYLTPADTEVSSSYDIAELVAMIDSLSDRIQVSDLGRSGDIVSRARSDTNEGSDAESVSPAIQQELTGEPEARLAAEQRETELRNKVAELSRSLAEARALSDADKHGSTHDADKSAVVGMHHAAAGSAQHETRLKITQSESHDIEFVVDRDEISLGRTADNEIHIRSPSISRRHARIVRKNGRSRIIDCGSKNGVYVNSFRVAEQELHDGDQIILGTVELTYKERVKS